MPALLPIFRRLSVAEIVDRYCPGGEEVSHGTPTLILGLNRLMKPKPMYEAKEWMGAILEDTPDVPAKEIVASMMA